MADAAIPDAADPYLLLRGVSTEKPVQDWLSPDDPLAVRPHPANGALVKQTPPVFRWPYDRDMVAWEVKLAFPDGTELRRMARENWLFLERPLAPGRYAWRVRGWPYGGGPTDWSQRRQFTVPRNAHEFVVPNVDQLFEQARKRERPRVLPIGEGWQRMQAAISSGDRSELFTVLRAKVERDFLDRPMRKEPATATFEVDDFEERRRLGKEIGRAGYSESNAARFSAYAWAGSYEPKYLREAMRRARHLASWDPRGSTGQRSHDHLAREIAQTLATVLDLTYKHWSAEERARLLEAIKIRTRDLFQQYIHSGPRPLRRVPYDSHGYRHAGGIASIAALLAGETPEARHWFRESLSVYLAMNNPWGGDDGGFGNSLNYAGWNLLDQLRQSGILEHAIGLPLRRSSWLQEVGQYLRYFAPTGTPDALFGDGHELDRSGLWRRLAQLYARHVPRSIYRRYAHTWGPGQADPDAVFAPLPFEMTGSGQIAATRSPDAVHFPSIGWTAMHSDLEDPDRISVYFLSSRLGSYNHSHAAQNSFVVHSGGRRLAISSGHYDYYGSTHHNSWTRQSQSKNVITFDGGEGQITRRMSARGQIVGFRHGQDADFVVGDASEAYGAKFGTAVRTLAYIRPDAILVYDLLQADQPRRWEWNIHAPTEFLEFGNRSAAILNDPASLCIEVLAGPPTDFSKHNQFGAPPDSKVGVFENQWHGAFITRTASRKLQMLVLLTVGCARKEINDVRVRDGGGYSLQIDGHNFVIDTTGIR